MVLLFLLPLIMHIKKNIKKKICSEKRLTIEQYLT